MLIIAGTFRIDAAKREVAIAAANEMMAETLKEKGCHAYSFTSDFSDPARVHLFERWESQEALAAHFATPHMAKFQGVIATLGVKDFAVQKYEISAVGPVR